MKAHLVCGLLGLMLFGWGLVLGLYLGERGRRRDAQNREVFGHPQRRPARAIPQPQDPEARARTYGYDPKTIETGVQRLQAEAKEQGRPLSREDAEAQVLAMLNPDSMMEGQYPW